MRAESSAAPSDGTSNVSLTGEDDAEGGEDEDGVEEVMFDDKSGQKRCTFRFSHSGRIPPSSGGRHDRPPGP